VDEETSNQIQLKQDEEKALQLEALRLQQEKEAKDKQDKIDLEDSSREIELDLVLIPAGKFMMGDPDKDHEVLITNSFYMGKHEVTQEQWKKVMGNNPSIRTKGPTLPVTDVSWNDCQEFIRRLNDKTNGGYRLPTEAEWEYACRAKTTTKYSYGDIITKTDANYGGAVGTTIKQVGSYKPNAFGLYDMHGNVWEWVEDWYGPQYYQHSPESDPKGIESGQYKIYRGGSWIAKPPLLRSAVRYSGLAATKSSDIGFRLAREAR
jgi:formylglycine-generating enzyme required for sulfatase activity